jgi:hypothetical protein
VDIIFDESGISAMVSCLKKPLRDLSVVQLLLQSVVRRTTMEEKNFGCDIF